MNSIHHDTPYALWSAESGQPFAGPPLVSGSLLLAPTQEPGPPSYHGALHAFSSADGHLHWQKPFEYALVSGLAAAQTSEVSETSEILILVATTSTDLIRGEGALVALDVTGEECWRWAPGVQRVSAPALVRSDDFSRSDQEATKVATTNLAPEFVKAVCVTCDARTFIVLDLASGEELTRAELEITASLAAPAVLDDVAYIPCRGPHLLAVGLDGGTRWCFTAADGPDSWLDRTPVVAGDYLFAVLSTGAVLALKAADGLLTWRIDVGPAGKPLSPPATDGERLFVGARDGLHALALADGHELWAFPTSRRITAAPVVSSDVVYVTCHDHHLYAIDAITGRELWRYEVERRIEVSPALAFCGEPSTPCVIVADRGGTVTAVTRPLSAAEHEAAGHWIEAASIYADMDQLARGAELLEIHGEPSRAAEMWKKAGKRERAAVQYEVARDWQKAAELWAAQGCALKQAEALVCYAQSLEGTSCCDKERATAWTDALQAFETEGEMERVAACQREVVRCLRQPVIALDVQLEKGLVQKAFSRLQFIVRNVGYGPARNLIIHAESDYFEGQVTDTRQITTLRAGRERVDWLGVRPLAYGDSVPLCVSVEYENQSRESCVYEQTIYLPVAQVEADRGAGRVFQISTAGGTVVIGDVSVKDGDFVGRGAVAGVAAAAPQHKEQYSAKTVAPQSIQIYERFQVTTQLLCASRQRPLEMEIDFPEDPKTGVTLPARVELGIIAPGFKVHGETHKTMEVCPQRDSPPCVFHLEAQRSGSAPISVEVRQYTKLVGTVTINIEVHKAKISELVWQVLEISLLLLFASVSSRTPLPATTHVLSFDRLSPADFERLCLWLVELEGYSRAEHLGLAGSEQGRDVIAYRPTPQGEELWYFQCKRYKSIGAKTLKDEVDKYLKLAQEKPHLLPAGVVFVVSCAVSAKVREEVGDYCDQHGLAYEFWALTELDMRVKRHPDLLREFFNVTS